MANSKLNNFLNLPLRYRQLKSPLALLVSPSQNRDKIVQLYSSCYQKLGGLKVGFKYWTNTNILFKRYHSVIKSRLSALPSMYKSLNCFTVLKLSWLEQCIYKCSLEKKWAGGISMNYELTFLLVIKSNLHCFVTNFRVLLV